MDKRKQMRASRVLLLARGGAARPGVRVDIHYFEEAFAHKHKGRAAGPAHAKPWRDGIGLKTIH